MNEETIVQSGSPAIAQEAVGTYNSLMESLNEDDVRRFYEEGYANTTSVYTLIHDIREHTSSLNNIIALDRVPDTYKVVYNNVNGEVNSFFVTAVFKIMLEEVLTEIMDYSTTADGEETGFELSEEEQVVLDQAVEDAHQEIPVNSETLLVDDTTSRFSSAIWYENIQKKVIILAGIGGIGSYVGFLLARMKPASMFIYDNDIVEAVNMSGQLYGQSDLGRPKVSALAEMIRNYAGYSSVFVVNERFTNESEASDIMICGFDNMAARSLFFDKWLDHVKSKPEEERCKCLYLDGRLDAEMFQIFCIRGDDNYSIDRYNNEFLFSDAEAEETICSYKQTTFCANMIASCMVNLFVNFCANEVGAYRDLPFLTTYNAETIYLKTEA